jgi:LacI family transcriptional regulator
VVVTDSSRLTVHDVAMVAGVSIATVSRVLNHRPGVSPATRAKVLAAVERLGYRPDRAARELSNRRHVTVGLCTAYGHRRLIPFFMLFLEHLMEELASSGLRLKDVPTGRDGLPLEPTDACMLFGAHADDPRIADLQKRKVPFVLIGRREGVRCVAADDVAGGRLAAEHLLRLGHTNALHVTGELFSQAMSDRAAGFVSAYDEAGAPRPRVLETDDLSALGAYRAMTRDLATRSHGTHLHHVHMGPAGTVPDRLAMNASARTTAEPSGARGLDYTAVFAATDELANGVIAALTDAGLRVPSDVSVIGFDDMPEIGDELTTIRQDIAAVAKTAVELLHEALNGAPVRGVRVPVSLVVRGTTAERR